MKIKVLSWNIWIDGHFDQVIEFLKTSNADIIGLQEAQNDVPGRDIITFLTHLGYDHVFVPIQKSWDGKSYNDGPAFFSKFPIVEKQALILSQEKARAAAMAKVDVNGTVLNVFSTHLIHTHQRPSDIQNEQGETLIKLLPKERAIVMGDFNATPDSEVIKKMRGVLVDSDPSSTPTWSVYPEGCNGCDAGGINIRLDYIFTTKDIKINSFKVEDSKASDHLPVSVEIEI